MTSVLTAVNFQAFRRLTIMYVVCTDTVSKRLCIFFRGHLQTVVVVFRLNVTLTFKLNKFHQKQSESEGVSPSTRIVHSIISEATCCFNYYISHRNFLFIFIDSFLSIIIICAISTISSITSIQLFREEGIIHRYFISIKS